MLLISNNVQRYMQIPEDAVVRVNMAWVPTIALLESIISANRERVVFLDFPEGRNKPPKPILTLEDAYVMCKKYTNIKYFAVSNVENISKVVKIQANLPPGIEFVPKIETLKGIKNFGHLVYTCGIRTAMLDKEDLYLDVKKDTTEFFKCVEHARRICEGLDVELLELEAVTFVGHKKEIR